MIKKIKMDDDEYNFDGGSVASDMSDDRSVQSGDASKLNRLADDDDEDGDNEKKKDDDDDDEEDEFDELPEERGKVSYIDGPSRGITNPILTKYEFGRMLGLRMMSLEAGHPPIITDTDEVDVCRIAMEEIVAGLCPVIILRPVGRKIERWYRRRKSDGTFTMELPP